MTFSSRACTGVKGRYKGDHKPGHEGDLIKEELGPIFLSSEMAEHHISKKKSISEKLDPHFFGQRPLVSRAGWNALTIKEFRCKINDF